MQTGSNILNHNITVDSYTSLKQIGLCTLIIDSEIQITKQYEFVMDVIQNTINSKEDMPQIPQHYSQYRKVYFAINGFNLSMTSTRFFLFQDDDLSNLVSSTSIQPNAQIILTTLMLATRTNCNDTDEIYFVDQVICKNRTECQQNKAAINDDSYCISCHYTCLECKNDDYTQCQTCEDTHFRQKSNFSCPCKSGFIDVGKAVCLRCKDVLDACQVCSSITKCTDCANGYEKTSDKCTCPSPKHMVSSLCLDFTGCLQASVYSGNNLCDRCDDSKNFSLNLSYICECKTGYYYNNSIVACQPSCGDGNTTTEQGCDDGNLQDGDGCSGDCVVQSNYYCSHDITTSDTSSCVSQVDLQCILLYTQRLQSQNTIRMFFNIQPQQSIFNRQIFDGLVTTSIANSSLQVYYDHQLSQLVLVIGYLQDIEGSNIMVNFSSSKLNVLHSSDHYLQFNITAINAKIAYNESFMHTQIIKYASMTISALAFFLAMFISISGEKNMALELILPLQASYFSMILLPQVGTEIINLKWLRFFNGFNYIQNYNYQRVFAENIQIVRMEYELEHILNVNIIIGLLLFTATSIPLLQIIKVRKKKEFKQLCDEKNDYQRLKNRQLKKKKEIKNDVKQQMNNAQTQIQEMNYEQMIEYIQEQIKTIQKRQDFILDRILVYGLLSVSSSIIFGFFIQLDAKKQLMYVYNEGFSDSMNLFGFGIVICGTIYLLFDYRSNEHAVNFKSNYENFPYLYIGIHMVYILVLSILHANQYVLYIALVIAVIPILLIIVQQPYYYVELFNIQTITSIYCQLILVICLGIYMFLGIMETSKQMQIIIAYAIDAIILLGILLTGIRVAKQAKFDCFDSSNRGKEDGNTKKGEVLQSMKLYVKDLNELGIYQSVVQDSPHKFLIQQPNSDEEQKQSHSKHNNSKPLQKLPQVCDNDNPDHPLLLIKQRLKKQFEQKMQKQ